MPLYRRGPGQEYVKSSLGITLMQLVNYTESLEIDPVKVRQLHRYVLHCQTCVWMTIVIYTIRGTPTWGFIVAQLITFNCIISLAECLRSCSEAGILRGADLVEGNGGRGKLSTHKIAIQRGVNL